MLLRVSDAGPITRVAPGSGAGVRKPSWKERAGALVGGAAGAMGICAGRWRIGVGKLAAGGVDRMDRGRYVAPPI